MAGKGKPGPDRQYPHTMEVKFDDDTFDFIKGMAATLDTSRAAVVRALAAAHVTYLEGLVRGYVASGKELVEVEASR